MGLHYVLQHLDRPGTYVRILFVDFSSAVNTIIPNLLLAKLTQLSVPTSVCQWITSFLTDRQQLVKLGKYTSNTRTISTGAPQGYILSPLLFFLIQDSDTSAYRQEVKELAVWCSLNNLELNMLKTVEMIVDFRRNPPALPPSPSWTALWLQWSHSGSWAAPSPRTWSRTFTLTPLSKRPSRGCTSFASWGSSTCHRSCWNSSTPPSLNPSSALQ